MPAAPVYRACRQVPFPADVGAGVAALLAEVERLDLLGADLRDGVVLLRVDGLRVADFGVDGFGRPAATIFGAARAEARTAFCSDIADGFVRRVRFLGTGRGMNALTSPDGKPDLRLRGTTEAPLLKCQGVVDRPSR